MNHDSRFTAIERQLAALAPMALTLDCDALLFAAGVAAATRRSRFSARVWPAATAVMTAATLLLALRGANSPAAKPQAATTIASTTRRVEPRTPSVQSASSPRYTEWWDFGAQPSALAQLVASRDLQLRNNQDTRLCCGGIDLPLDEWELNDSLPTKAVTNRQLLEEMLRPTM